MVWTRRWRRIALASGLALTVTLQVTAPVVATGPPSQIHRVQSGETLSEIAETYAVPLATLIAANDIADQDRVYAGETLVIPQAAAPPTVTLPVTYVVQDGDTLEGIALALGTTQRRLLQANPAIDDPDTIFAGQVLRIPGLESGALTLPRVPRGEVAALLTWWADRYDLDPALVQALAWQESGWQQHTVSPSGAVGVMQLLPDTGRWIGAEIVGVPLDVATSPSDNILAGVAFFGWLLDRTGSEEAALSLYVQGEGSVARNGVYPETRDYVDNVLAIRDYIARYGAPPR
ncbi:MAG: LysM peptidoglycan-binding domain-containing protein [Chloroflexota bacterium]|nr:LysM peptidoglycan-binding domain-containing protein [Chloroflexota bacterium]